MPGSGVAWHRVGSRGCTAASLIQEAKTVISIGCSCLSSLQPQTESFARQPGEAESWIFLDGCEMNGCLCVIVAADRKGFARQLGRAIKRPSSTSDIKDPDPQGADGKGSNQKASFPPTYEDPSVPPAFTRNAPQVPSPLTPHVDSNKACSMLSAASAVQGTPLCRSAASI